MGSQTEGCAQVRLRDLVSGVEVDLRKLTEYALNTESPTGKDKAFVFASQRCSFSHVVRSEVSLMADLFEVIELTVDLPERGLRAGVRGAIVELHSDREFEVEFCNQDGETIDFLALSPAQFAVVWRAKTKSWVPLPKQVADWVSRLPEDSGAEVLDFARSLSHRTSRRAKLPSVAA